MSPVRFLLVVAAVVLGWAALTFVLQRRFLYPGTALEPLRPVGDGAPPGVERFWVEHADGRAESWLLLPPGADEPRPLVAFFHGNGELMDDWVSILRPFPERLGVGLLLVEYPGYGRSTGRPSEEGIVEVATSAWDRAAARPEVDETRMVAMGRSLGGGPAAALTRQRAPAALILQSAFTDVAAVAARHFWVPSVLVRDRFPVQEAVAGFQGTVLVLHGRRDRVVPFRHGEALAAAGERVTFLPLDCGHNDCPPPGASWWAAVERFLDEAGVLAGTAS